MNTSQFLISGWAWNPIVLGVALAALIVYRAVLRPGKERCWFFALALGTFLLALISPLNALADGYLFSAHMLQHILLLLVVPALLLLSLPRDLALPRSLKGLMHPAVGWLAGVGSMWLWHVPALCNAAVTSKPIQAAQTLSLIVLGGLFWWQVLAPREDDRLTPPAAVLYLFSACTACSVLGIILTLSPVTVCPIYMHAQDRWGLLGTIRGAWGMTPEKDQQIGGLLMWVPMCAIYMSAILAQLARWFAPSHPQEHAR
jgi:cytochrome c oxidase assembly factor CtaG